MTYDREPGAVRERTLEISFGQPQSLEIGDQIGKHPHMGEAISVNIEAILSYHAAV